MMPTHPAKARCLLKRGRASVHKRVPFTIRLRDREGGSVQAVRLKLDPGSRTTGVAVVRESGGTAEVLHLAELVHKPAISAAMLRRRNHRRRRRAANLRHRKPRFLNRRRADGWLPPSLTARLNQTTSWVERYRRLLPVSAISVETVRFDTRKLRDPEISGAEYQAGELSGYEVKEYLLEKWGRRCAYCRAERVPLQTEHIVPRSRGGSDSVSNLTIACAPCNLAKGSFTAEEFGHPRVQARARLPLAEAAAINATRGALNRALVATGLPVEQGTGGRTKYNRSCLGLPKVHALDALCVGVSTPRRIVGLDRASVLVIRAVGRGRYARTIPDASGFPRSYKTRRKSIAGFRTGDLVRASVGRGVYEGSLVVRRSGYFDLKHGKVRVAQGVGARRCELLQRFDGYLYELGPAGTGRWPFGESETRNVAADEGCEHGPQARSQVYGARSAGDRP